MDKPLKNLFELQLKSLTGFDFQEIVIRIFQYLYGITGFTDIRLHKDKGCDGIIESEKRIVACFGPEENLNTQKRHNDFNKKANSDFALYKKNWQSNYPNWSMVINHNIDPIYDDQIKKLSPNATIIGLNQLLSVLEKIKSHERRTLGDILRIDPEFFSSDFIKEILEDLLKEEEIFQIDMNYRPKELTQMTDKIEMNFKKEDIIGINSEYEEFLIQGLFTQIHDLLYGYEDKEIEKIKVRVIFDFNNKTNGDFKEKLKQLTIIYLEKYSNENDDEYMYYIRGLLLYLFEQCLIGIKSRGEK